MPSRNNKALTNKTDELVRRVRRRFFVEFFNENPSEYEVNDIRRLRDDDWFVKRFILARGRKEEESLQMINGAMKWRKEMGVHDITADYFPREFYIIGALFPYEKDRSGNATLYMRTKMVKRISEMGPYMRKFLAWQLWKLDEENNGNGWVIVFDGTGTGPSNCDVDLLMFLISSLKNYFPLGLEYVLVHNVPRILKYVWQLARSWIPLDRQEIIRFTHDSEIIDYIDPANLPDYMGGLCKASYNIPPETSPSCFDFGVNEAKVPLERVKEIVKKYESLMPEGYFDASII